LIITNKGSSDLSSEVDFLSPLLGCELALLLLDCILGLLSFCLSGFVPQMGFKVFTHSSSDFGFLVGVGKVGSRSWDWSLMTFFDFSLVDSGDGSEEIGSVTTVRVDETEILKVASSFSSWTVVDDSTFGNDGDLVVEVVNTITGLVETDYGGVVFDVGEGS
jgi:hypothetical protein